MEQRVKDLAALGGNLVGLAPPRHLRGLDRPTLLQTTERGVQRTERDLPESEFAQCATEFVPVAGTFHQQTKNGEIEHDDDSVYRFDTYVYIETIYDT